MTSASPLERVGIYLPSVLALPLLYPIEIFHHENLFLPRELIFFLSLYVYFQTSLIEY